MSMTPLVACDIPLFVMLTGPLLLEPSKVDEPLGVFFRIASHGYSCDLLECCVFCLDFHS
jgi:hypothetical protein